jgi:hypothetical protein
MRRFHWVVLAVGGILLGCLSTVHPLTSVAQPVPAMDAAGSSHEETMNQLREINAQLKELSTLLCSGQVRVIVVINPDAKKE